MPKTKKIRRNKKNKNHFDVLEEGKKAGRKARTVLCEFKEFISRGNVTDMAVGIIVGTAFTAIINSLVNDIVTPLFGLFIGGIDFSTLSFTVNSFIFPEHSVTVAYGEFLQALFSFFVIAICVFFMVKMINAFRRKKTPEQPAPAKPEEHIVLLTEIRDLLKGDYSQADEGQLTFDDINHKPEQQD